MGKILKETTKGGQVRFIEEETTVTQTAINFDELLADIKLLKSELKGKMRLYKKYVKELSHEEKKNYGGKMTEVEKAFDING